MNFRKISIIKIIVAYTGRNTENHKDLQKECTTVQRHRVSPSRTWRNPLQNIEDSEGLSGCGDKLEKMEVEKTVYRLNLFHG